MKRRIAAIVVGLSAAIIMPTIAYAHDPISTLNKRTFASDPTTYRLVSSPGTWFATAASTALATNFHNGNNNSNVAHLAYSSTGAGDVKYEDAASSPCGTGNTSWLQCAENPGNDENWTIHVRNLTNGPNRPSGWTWYEVGSTCGTHPGTCWYMKRALIHEAGHAMLAFPDMCLGSQLCRSESDTVMNSHDPEVGTTGSTHWDYQRCDEAGAQLRWDVDSYSGEYGDCFDHITSHGVNGLVTDLTAAPGTTSLCVFQSTTIAGRLNVHDYASYNGMGANPLAGRTVEIDRNSAAYASTTATSASGNNYSQSVTSNAGGTFTFTVHFDASSTAGIDSSPVRSFTIRWNTIGCPT